MLPTFSSEELLPAIRIHRTHGKSYFFATRFFPKQLREATHVLYAFVRLADDLVDCPASESKETPAENLRAFQHSWHEAFFQRKSDQPILALTATLFRETPIPYAYSEAFLKSMETDLTVSSYETYRDLETYMYGSATVVGLMMCSLIGVSDPRATTHAKALAEAMQLTNFLRDISEDLERGRIYIPKEDMAKFGVQSTDLGKGMVTDAFRRLMIYEITRARALYAEAEAGVQYLAKEGRFPVLVAARLYAGILDSIEAASYNIFRKRVRVSFFRKCLLTLRAYSTFRSL